jgi:hypothetical protein
VTFHLVMSLYRVTYTLDYLESRLSLLVPRATPCYLGPTKAQTTMPQRVTTIQNSASKKSFSILLTCRLGSTAMMFVMLTRLSSLQQCWFMSASTSSKPSPIFQEMFIINLEIPPQTPYLN